ncbi:MAG: ATP-binding protein [Bacteroidota bacterium]
MRPLQKIRFTTFISVLLGALILAVAGVGYYTYNSLDKVVDQLRFESNPNFNLIVIKDIMVSITGIENDMESYLLTDDQTYKNRYDQRINDARLFLDSLKMMNQNDRDFLRYTDSLGSMIKQKVAILGELEELVSYNLSGSINDLANRLDKMPIDIDNKVASDTQRTNENSEPATVEDSTTTVENTDKKKKGWLARIFTREKEEAQTRTETQKSPDTSKSEYVGTPSFKNDSAFIAQKTLEYRKKLQFELIQLRNQTKVISDDIRQRELELAQNQQIIQTKIIDLLTHLEEREIDKIKLQNLNAQITADEANDQVLSFSLLTIMLLLATIYIVYGYIEKNKAYQKILSKATEDAKNLAKAKEQFLANMSHEIRTPMNAISGFTQQLLKSDLSKSQREQLDIVHRSSDHLLHILNDVLDFSKLQANKLILEDKPYDLPQLMNDSVKLMQHKADEKHIGINYYPDNVPNYVLGDPYRLKQILINLVSNSIKFTDKGSVDIYLSVKKKYRANELQLIVADSGIGIPKDQQSRIMMEFEQAGSASDHKGTGLGLSITQKLVELHDGRMKLESEEGKGTKITINLPFVESKEPPKVQVNTNKDLNLEGLEILIADDEPFNIKLLTTILNSKGARWTACKDGKEALEQLDRAKYDIALLDLKMPHYSGLEVAENLRKGAGLNNKIPLVALTATVLKEEMEQCIQYGFDHVLRKPFDENELFEIIKSEVSASTMISDKKKSQSKSKPNQMMFDLTDLKELGDESFIIEMLETFLDSSEPGVDNIKQYFEEKRWIELADEAHKIVAPARYLCATQVVDELKKLEIGARKEDPKITAKEIKTVIQTLDKLNRELSKYLVKAQV